MSQTFELWDVFGFIGQYLQWASQQAFAGLSMPVISYRGHASYKWNLLPSMYRYKSDDIQFLRQSEAQVICEYRRRYELSDWKDIDVLAFAQHHGAPTGLLDWSENPFVGLWFAVSGTEYDQEDGLVYQLDVMRNVDLIRLSESLNLDHAWGSGACDNPFLRVEGKITPLAGTCLCKSPIHVFRSPPTIERSERQHSVFLIATDEYVNKPLDTVLRDSLQKMRVPAHLKPRLRFLLTSLALDPYGLYGDPDSLGKSLAYRLNIKEYEKVVADCRKEVLEQSARKAPSQLQS